MVNVRIVADRDAGALAAVVAEFEARGMVATVLTKPDFVTNSCTAVAELHDAGFEIMAYARPAPDDDAVTLATLSGPDQETHMDWVVTAVEACLDEPVYGMGCVGFDQNADSHALANDLGLLYNVGFVARTEHCMPGYEIDALPYRPSSCGFWAAPLHSVYFEGERVAFSDTSFVGQIEPGQWQDLLEAEFDEMNQQGRPLTVEIHPDLLNNEEGWLAAFIGFLDYADEQGSDFITVEELVEWTQAGPPGCGCE
jgi:hypothetical protein